MRKRILVAPLDWGLGHATRCVPIINALVGNDCEVMLAGNGNSLVLLQKEFPSLPTFELPGYNIHYSNGSSQVLSMLFQLPWLRRAIAAEHALVNDLIRTERFDGIISDNRYGVYSNDVPSVLMTHQLKLMMPQGLKIFESIVQKLLHRYINKFDECWVPDISGDENLSGELSHQTSLEIPLRYIGPLSRLSKVEHVSDKFDLLVLLSGPEPQRTLLEKKVVKQLTESDLKVMLIQGLPQSKKHESLRDGFDVMSYANAKDIETLMSQSKYVIARSGYSSIMDVHRLGGNALLIPTPGQTEQEYLAKHLSNKNWCVTISQKELDIESSLEKLNRHFDRLSAGFGGYNSNLDFDQHKQVIANWLSTI